MVFLDEDPVYGSITESDMGFLWGDGEEYMSVLPSNFNEYEWD